MSNAKKNLLANRIVFVFASPEMSQQNADK